MRYYIYFDFVCFFSRLWFFPHRFCICSCLQSDQEPCCTAWIISSSSSFCSAYKKKKTHDVMATAAAVAITVTFRFSNYKLNLWRILFRFQFKSICVCVICGVLRLCVLHISFSLPSRKTASQHGIEWFHHTKWILTDRVQKHTENNHSACIYVLHLKPHTKHTQMTKAICCLRKFQHSFLSQFFSLLFNNWIKSKWVRTNGTDWMKKCNIKRNIWQLSHWNCVLLQLRLFLLL